jgi:glycosyltransferase involved in cell wall biosynthesis
MTGSHVLFITRKFPPSVGGMQKVACELHKSLSAVVDVKLISWGGSNRWLPLVFIYLLFKATWNLTISNIAVIYLQDGLLAPLGVVLKIFRKPVVITIHGKDITHNSAIYQFFIPKMINKMDRVICVSEATANECIRRGISPEKISVISNGVADELYMCGDKKTLKLHLAEKLGFRPDSRLLLTVGRLVERKGVHWFIANVMPELVKTCPDCVYLVVGSGRFSSEVRKTIAANNLDTHVLMLGNVDNETLRQIYNVSDIFIMPNIPVSGDMEGFGVVALEAASCRLPVVASNLEGIKDAVRDGQNGFLLDPGDAASFTGIVKEFFQDTGLRENLGEWARKFTIQNFGWDSAADKYSQEFFRLQGYQLKIAEGGVRSV